MPVLRGPRKCLLGFLGCCPEDLEKLARVLFPELVLNSGWGRAAVLPRVHPGPEDSLLPGRQLPECEGVKGPAPASSRPLCPAAGQETLSLMTPALICLGKMLPRLLKAAVVFSEIVCFQGSSM